MSRRRQPLGIGVVGLGDWGERHLQAWTSIPGVSVVALASHDPARAESLGRRYGVPRWYASADELAADPAVEAVSIVNDERHHLAAALAVIDAGKAVLVEKPMALTVEDARAMVEAATRAGVILMPGHVLRFDPRFAGLKDRIDAGSLGRVVSVHSRRLLPVDRYATYDRTHVMANVGVHDIDLALWYMPGDVERVTTFERNIQGGGTPDVVWSVMEFDHGGIAVVTVLWLVPSKSGVFLDSLTEVAGTHGMGAVRQPGDGLTLWLQDGPQVPDMTLAPIIDGGLMGALRDELAYFAQCVLLGSHPRRVTGADGIRALEVALRIQTDAYSQSR